MSDSSPAQPQVTGSESTTTSESPVSTTSGAQATATPERGLPPGYVGTPELVAGYPVAVAHYALPPIDTKSGNATWRLFVGIALAFVAAIAIFLTSVPTVDRAVSELPTGAGPISQPISLYEVVATYERPCSSVETAKAPGTTRFDERGEPSIRCYEVLDSSRLTFEEVDALLVRPTPGSRTSWEMSVTLDQGQIEPFRALTTTLAENQGNLAVVLDNTVLSSTRVPEPVTNGTGLLGSGLSKFEAQSIFLDLRTF